MNDAEVNDLPGPERARGQEHVGKAGDGRRRVCYAALQRLSDKARAILAQTPMSSGGIAHSSVARLYTDAIRSHETRFARGTP